MSEEIPILDARRFGLLRLHDAGPDDASLVELVRSFTAGAAKTMDEMRLGVAGGDGPAVRGLAHRLRGSSAIFGAMRLCAALAELEQALEGGAESRELGALLDQVGREIEAASTAMESNLTA